MSYRMTLALAALAFALAPGAANAAKYYKWTDDKGVVHYTEKPGPGQSTEVNVRPGAPASAPDVAAETETAAPATTDPASAERIAQLRQQQCDRARTNVALLEGGGAVMEVKDESAGPAEPMTDAERKERLDVARKFVERFCTN